MADEKKDDPTFLYFPNSYRWSMGLLICLSAAPWLGIEIDEVNRVGLALKDKVGDDDAWFEEWVRMGDEISARGRDAERANHRLTAAITRPANASCIRARNGAWTSTPSRWACLRKPRQSWAVPASSPLKYPT